MDVFNISLDNNEADTSQDELDEDEITLNSTALNFSGNANVKKTKREGIEYRNRNEFDLMGISEEIRNEFQTWQRPQIPEGSLLYSSSVMQEQPDPFHFFMIDSVSTVSGIKHPAIKLDEAIQNCPLQNVMRLFGITKIHKVIATTEDVDGYTDIEAEENKVSASVCCNVHGFIPYFYVLPTGKLSQDRNYWLSSKADEFMRFLNSKIKESVSNDISVGEEYADFVTNNPCVFRIEVLNVKKGNTVIYHFHTKGLSGESDSFVLKIYCTLPRFIWKAHTVLDDLIYDDCSFQSFESNMNNNVRFLTDQNLPGCSWFEIKPGKYFQRHDAGESPHKESYCQIEIDVHYKDIVSLPEDHHRYDSDPPLRVLSFDIEVMVSPNDLNSPKDGFRQVIQIGNVLGNYYQGAKSEDCIVGKTVFVVGTCDPIPNTKVIQFYIKEQPQATNEEFLKDAEAKMLKAWRDFIIQMDPDIIVGYNIKKFDIPYLIDRANVLSHYQPAKLLPFLGRMKKIKSQIRPIENYLKKVHPYDEKNVDIQGRVVMDLYPVLVRHDRRSNGKGGFKLSNVAMRYLPKTEKKQDVSFKEIEGLQHGNSKMRSRLAEYCVQDSMIPFLLLFECVPSRNETIRFIELYLKKSHIGGNLLRYLLNKSMSYNDYFKQVRVQKNPGKVVFVPETPSPKKFLSPASTARSVARNLFGNNKEGDGTSSSTRALQQ